MSDERITIGIVGCGAIGSRIAKSIQEELSDHCRLTGLYDVDTSRVEALAKELTHQKLVHESPEELFNTCQLVVEAVNTPDAYKIIEQALNADCHILIMSVGRILDHPQLFEYAQKHQKQILIPTGAMTGIDTIKAASLDNLQSVTLTTRKPPSGFQNNTYLEQQGINLENIKGETLIFEGGVADAIKYFPQNINVAATLSLACGDKDKLKIRIITSPEYKTNSHEITAEGNFGRMTSFTDNVVCPDNPKTSYLAVLSAIQTIKQFAHQAKVGT